jgi:hypothetical protein
LGRLVERAERRGRTKAVSDGQEFGASATSQQKRSREGATSGPWLMAMAMAVLAAGTMPAYECPAPRALRRVGPLVSHSEPNLGIAGGRTGSHHGLDHRHRYVLGDFELKRPRGVALPRPRERVRQDVESGDATIRVNLAPGVVIIQRHPTRRDLDHGSIRQGQCMREMPKTRHQHDGWRNAALSGAAKRRQQEQDEA